MVCQRPPSFHSRWELAGMDSGLAGVELSYVRVLRSTTYLWGPRGRMDGGVHWWLVGLLASGQLGGCTGTGNVVPYGTVPYLRRVTKSRLRMLFK